MTIEKVKEFFKEFNKENDIFEFPVSSATVELAAHALNIEPARICKTLSFKSNEGCILVCTAGDARIDNKKFKIHFGLKAKMLSPEEVIDFTGHAIGGVCPFGISNINVKVYNDISLKRFDTIFPACGSSNSAIELSPDELFKYSNAIEWIDVCKVQ